MSGTSHTQPYGTLARLFVFPASHTTHQPEALDSTRLGLWFPQETKGLSGWTTGGEASTDFFTLNKGGRWICVFYSPTGFHSCEGKNHAIGLSQKPSPLRFRWSSLFNKRTSTRRFLSKKNSGICLIFCSSHSLYLIRRDLTGNNDG